MPVSFPGRITHASISQELALELPGTGWLPRRASLQLVILIVGAHPASSSSSAFFQVRLLQSAYYSPQS